MGDIGVTCVICDVTISSNVTYVVVVFRGVHIAQYR